MTRLLRGVLAVLIVVSLPALADWQPTKPVRIVVPFAPGGQPDVIARALSEPLSKALGQPVVVENRPGAGGNIAADAVAKSAPDGHTLLMGTNGPLAVSPALAKNLAYDVGRDFAFVTLVGTSPSLIAVHPSLGAATLAEVVAKAKAQPGKLNFASVGKGSVSQLSMEQLNAAAGIDTMHIPYNGGAPAVAALLAGDVQLLSLNPTALIAHVQAGRIRVVAQTGARRSPLIPDLPTVAESGFPGFEAPVWMAIVVPARTPPEAVKRLHAELAKIIRAPELKARLWDKQWIDPLGSTPEEAARVVDAETRKWARIGRALNLTLE
ncbi:MAG TPA: tripartite tricarboxylate transporter substrate binding protein [Usitatibacteraceae bacterium]|nr:tripartite tricarboxylate transporter substrate binding protein [Usitatibacteraceae bacterium]